PPRIEQLDHTLTLWITRLDLTQSRNRVLAAKRQQRVAHPLAPLFKAAQGDARPDRFCLPPPAPDCQRRSQEIGPPRLDALKETGAERTLLRVLALGIERRVDEAPCQVLSDRQTVAGQSEERRQLNPDHLRAAKDADPGRPLSQERGERVRFQ